MSLLPERMLPKNEPIGDVGKDGTVIARDNFWYLLYNISGRTLGNALRADQLQILESVDMDTVEADTAALVRPLINARLLAQEALLADPPALAQPLASLAPGGSPFVWTAPFAGNLLITGGTVSAVSLSRDGVTAFQRNAALLANFVGETTSLTNTVTSGSFTPSAGQQILLLVAFNDPGASAPINVTTTSGIYGIQAPPGNPIPGGTTNNNDYLIAINPFANAVAQTVTATATSGTADAGVIKVMEMSGSGPLSGWFARVVAPGTGSGALRGTPTYLPMGATLFVWLWDRGPGGSPTITPVNGTTVNVGGFGDVLMKYTGADGWVTPAFTTSVGGDTYELIHALVLPQPPALDMGRPIPVCRGDQVTVTYSSAPTLTFIPWGNA